VQASALERALSARLPESVSVIINSLLMAYHTLSQDLTDIVEFVRTAAETAVNTDAVDFEDFSDSLDAYALAGYSAAAYDEALAAFTARFSTMREEFKRELAGATDFYLAELDREGSPGMLAGLRLERALSMAREMAGVFKSINGYYNGQPGLAACAGDLGRIAKGIAETVDIKAQSLEENAQIFAEAMAPVLEKIGLDSTPASPVDTAERVFADMARELILYKKDDQRVMSVIKKYLAIRPDNEIYSDYFEALRRPADKRAGELDAKIMKFKKEHLLYELSTFEEIQNYSLPRLRDAEDRHIRDFVGFLDRRVEVLDAILKQNGIELIRPRPHDMFNGREHEVLMADKSDEFKKGEIIKLMNSGYRQGNHILLRANVIASR
jgi:hypothetical protein